MDANPFGQSPEEMLADIRRHSRFTSEDFETLATEGPIDLAELHRRIRKMVDEADEFIRRLPSDMVGVLFMQGERPMQPDLDHVDRYDRRSGAVGGIWPTSPEISGAMLENYSKGS